MTEMYSVVSGEECTKKEEHGGSFRPSLLAKRAYKSNNITTLVVSKKAHHSWASELGSSIFKTGVRSSSFLIAAFWVRYLLIYFFQKLIRST